MDNVNAINNFFYFIYNISFIKDENGCYYPELILKTKWPCGDLKYIKDKWMQHLRNVDGNETTAMLNFYSDIDSRHRRAMAEWILENFDSGYEI